MNQPLMAYTDTQLEFTDSYDGSITTLWGAQGFTREQAVRLLDIAETIPGRTIQAKDYVTCTEDQAEITVACKRGRFIVGLPT
jgi:hypothetical protein